MQVHDYQIFLFILWDTFGTVLTITLMLQKGLGNYQVSVEGFKQKIENIQEALGVPLQASSFQAKKDISYICTNCTKYLYI